MRRVAKPKRQPAKKLAGRKAVSKSKLRTLREQAKTVRRQVAQDREQIAAESRQAIADAVQEGKLTKLTVLLRPDEQNVLDALDQYRSQHGGESSLRFDTLAIERKLHDVNPLRR
jgi:hypothetical protein